MQFKYILIVPATKACAVLVLSPRNIYYMMCYTPILVWYTRKMCHVWPMCVQCVHGAVFVCNKGSIYYKTPADVAAGHLIIHLLLAERFTQQQCARSKRASRLVWLDTLMGFGHTPKIHPSTDNNSLLSASHLPCFFHPSSIIHRLRPHALR